VALRLDQGRWTAHSDRQGLALAELLFRALSRSAEGLDYHVLLAVKLGPFFARSIAPGSHCLAIRDRLLGLDAKGFPSLDGRPPPLGVVLCDGDQVGDECQQQ
jgi:hypothetical protein